MNKDKFWELIDDAKEQCKDNIADMHKVLQKELNKYSLEEMQKFLGIFDTYKKAADRKGIVSIAAMMNHYLLTDDGFNDFRNWLIAQGKELYMQTMKDPEMLAVNPVKPIDGWYEYEEFGYVPMRAIEERTGNYRDAIVELPEEEKNEILSEIEFGEYIDLDLTEVDIKIKFPTFAKRFDAKNTVFTFGEEAEDMNQTME